MCDTMYAGRDYSATGAAWFAKNSDRHPEEPQAFCLVPAKEGSFAMALSKPSWMSGAEMGVNEKGVAIGNEAVFSKWKAKPEGVLGMDTLRSALSRAATAREAVDFIASFTEANDQGGNGAYRGKLFYDNSYLVADAEEAFVLETAGRRWALRKVRDAATISNCYGIGADWDEADAATARPGGRGDWTASVASPLYPPFTRGRERRTFTRVALEAGRGALDLGGVLLALRSHGKYRPGRSGSMASPCMHEGGFPVDNATTASLAVSWPSRGAPVELWFSGTSYPCISLFKPLLLAEGRFVPLWTRYDYGEDAWAAYDLWSRQLEWIRGARAGRLSLDTDFVARRNTAQDRLVALAAEASTPGGLEEASLGRIRAGVDAVVAEWYGGLAGFPA